MESKKWLYIGIAVAIAGVFMFFPGTLLISWLGIRHVHQDPSAEHLKSEVLRVRLWALTGVIVSAIGGIILLVAVIRHRGGRKNAKADGSVTDTGSSGPSHP